MSFLPPSIERIFLSLTAILGKNPGRKTMNSEDWRVAIVVDPSLTLGELANTVAVLGIGLGAAHPALAGARLTDGRGRQFRISANRPVPVLQASPEALLTLLMKALPAPEEAIVVPFPRFARQLHDYRNYEASMPKRDLATEIIDGVGLAGPSKWVRSLTGSLKLLRPASVPPIDAAHSADRHVSGP